MTSTALLLLAGAAGVTLANLLACWLTWRDQRRTRAQLERLEQRARVQERL